MVRPDVSQPDGRAEGTGRRAAGAGDHLSAASATWLSISGLLRALRAPRQPPRHRRVSQPWPTFFLQGTEALGPPLVPIRPAWGGPGVALALGTPWVHLERVDGGDGGGKAMGYSGSAWGSHSTLIPRGSAAALLPAIGVSARDRPEATPLSFPGTSRPLVRLSLPTQTGKAGAARCSLCPLPSPGGCLAPAPGVLRSFCLSPPWLSSPDPVQVRFIHALKPLADSCNSYLAFFSFSLPLLSSFQFFSLPPRLSGFGGLETANSTASGFNFGGFGLTANPAVSFNIGNFGVSTTSATPFNFGNSLASAGRYWGHVCIGGWSPRMFRCS